MIMGDPVGGPIFHYLLQLCSLCVFQVSIYVMQIIFGAVDVPSKLIALAALTYLGRRYSQAACLFLSALVIFTNIFIPTGDLRTSTPSHTSDKSLKFIPKSRPRPDPKTLYCKSFIQLSIYLVPNSSQFSPVGSKAVMSPQTCRSFGLCWHALVKASPRPLSPWSTCTQGSSTPP